MTRRRHAGQQARREAATPPKARRSPNRFLVRVLALWTAGWLLTSLAPGLEGITIRATMISLLALLHLCFLQAVASGDTIASLGVRISIVSECTSLAATVLLLGAIAAYPAPMVHRVVGMLAGGLSLWVYNLVRVIALIVVLARFPSVFDLIHIYLWQTVTLIAVIALFGLWMRESDRRCLT